MAGLFLLLTILGGIFAQVFISERLVDFRDAAATANSIVTHTGLYESGFTVYLIEMACQVVTAAFFYLLLRPVNNAAALTAAFLELTGCAVKTFARVFFIAPLFVLGAGAGSAAGGASALTGFTTEQAQSVALLLLKVNDRGAALALAFFGFATLLNGALIFRSTFLPKFLGASAMLSGFGWLTFLYPPLGYRAFMFIAPVGLLSSAATIFWLLVKGVSEERWKKRAFESA